MAGAGAWIATHLPIIWCSKTPNEGEPGSVHENPGSGQERVYGPDGKPLYDIDWDHDHGSGVPHSHNWQPGPNGRPERDNGNPVSAWPKGRTPSWGRN